jgi:hypothetical protein
MASTNRLSVMVPAIPALAQDGDRLEVHQVRGGKLPGDPDLSPGAPTVGTVVAHDVGEDRRVEHDQPRDRCSAMSSTACWSPTSPPRRCSMRASTSWSVGFSARRRSSVDRYCWSDWFRCSARRWSAA